MSELAAILVALIAAAASLVATTLSKEQKVSEFRQAWINELRSELAAFLSSARAFARAMAARDRHGSATDDAAKVPFTKERLGDIRATAAESFYRIKLRLNPNETDHSELLRLLSQAIGSQNTLLEGTGSTHEEVLAAVDRAADFAPQVLKAEWNRVKDGERPYRVVRASAAWVVAVALLAFALLWVRQVMSEESTAADGPNAPAASGQ